MPDLDLYHLLIQQMPLGTFDGADYTRLDAVWKVPHDGSMPTLVGPWQTWPLTTPARMIANERQLHEMQTALAQRDALIVRLTQELEAARRVPAGVALAATGMAANRAAPPALDAPPELPCPVAGCTETRPTRQTLGSHVFYAHGQNMRALEREQRQQRLAAPVLAARVAEPALPFDLAVELQANPDDKRRRAHRAAPPDAEPLPPPTPVADAPSPARWVCPRCERDTFARSVAHPDCCMDCAAKLPKAA